MTREEIMKKVTEILVKYSKGNISGDQVTEQTTLLKDLNINSARLVDIILDFEDVFGIQVEDADADAVTTVGQSVDLIMGKLKV